MKTRGTGRKKRREGLGNRLAIIGITVVVLSLRLFGGFCRRRAEVYFEFVNDMQARKYELATDEEVNKISEELIRKNHKAYLWFKK